jgi:hypothetical protein
MADTQDYALLVPPGAKVVWTVQTQERYLSLGEEDVLPLPANSMVLLLARDEDAIVKVATETQEQQGRLKIGDSAQLEGPVTLALWECACGTTHCMERHRLEQWNPAQVVQRTTMNARQNRKAETALTLWDYVASAVKGPQASIKTGAFVQGIYFPLLTQEGWG